MKEAPFFAEGMADGPPQAQSFWIDTDDGVRLRMCCWMADGAEGTVFIFPGRTEYVEKYDHVARAFAACGLSSVAVDWRGQGLADRLIDDERSGHVHHFTDYQRDVAALVGAAGDLNLPRPYHLLAHSMGGAIGLRAVMEELPVASCVFSAPMWGIQLSGAVRPVAWSLSWGGRHFGIGQAYAPGTVPESYVLTAEFEGNKLTGDAEMYQLMVDQTRAHPELGLGGPSLRWLYEALRESRVLSRRPSPPLPCMALAGDGEEIVDVDRIRDRVARWPGARLEMFENARHEVMMERPDIRLRIFEMMSAFYRGAAALTDRGSQPDAERPALQSEAP